MRKGQERRERKEKKNCKEGIWEPSWCPEAFSERMLNQSRNWEAIRTYSIFMHGDFGRKRGGRRGDQSFLVLNAEVGRLHRYTARREKNVGSSCFEDRAVGYFPRKQHARGIKRSCGFAGKTKGETMKMEQSVAI